VPAFAFPGCTFVNNPGQVVDVADCSSDGATRNCRTDGIGQTLSIAFSHSFCDDDTKEGIDPSRITV
jgi:hypothetical protein